MTNFTLICHCLTVQQLADYSFPIAHDLSVVVGFGFGSLFWLILFWIVFGGGRR